MRYGPNAMQDVTPLKRLAWLSDELEAADWQALSERAVRRDHPAGEVIFEPTSEARSVYLLEAGRVRIYRISRTGDRVIFGFIHPGEVFGELAGFGDHERESFADAEAPSTSWRLPLDLFREWVRTRPGFAHAVASQIGDRMKRVESRVEGLVFHDVRARLAAVLVELAQDFGEATDDGHRIALRLSQESLAHLIGASRQSVNVAMTRLRREGLVDRANGHLLLSDPERLLSIRDAGR